MKLMLLSLLSVISLSAFADGAPIVHCESYEGNFLTIVEIDRSVVDLNKPTVRFEDKLVSQVRTIDPGSSFPWIEGKVQSDVDLKTRNMVYKGEGFALTVNSDYSTWKDTDNTGGYVISGAGTMSSTNERGQIENLQMQCDTYDHF
jgi:hypothetical protein